MSFFLLLIPFFSVAQYPSGLIWDRAVGCEEATMEHGFNVQNPEECIKVCEGSTVTYTLVGGNPQQWINVQWLVTGGNLQTSTNTTATVQWGSQGWGSILLIVDTADGMFEQETCIELLASPEAAFTIHPNGPGIKTIDVCLYETVYFENLSNPNGGSPLVSYFWDFGDNTTSTAFEPDHVFQNQGSYTVSLTVTNACNCSSSIEVQVIVSDPGVQIVCNSIVCENSTETYTAVYPPSSGEPVECSVYTWEATGGDILGQHGPEVRVQWNNVDENGFGYLTFFPDACQVDCALPVTIKVPVIKNDIEMDGPSKICEGEQFRYSIPRWPSTEVEWKVIPAGGALYPSDQSNEIIFMANLPGTYVLEAIYTNTLMGCGGVALKEIEVIPAVSIQGPVQLCVGFVGSFTNSDGLYVNWVLEGPTGTQTGSGTTFNHVFSAPGLYSLSLGQGDHCLDRPYQIQVSPIPVAPTGIDGPLEVCLGVPITYSVNPPPGSAIAVWTTVNGFFPETGTQGATGEQVIVVFDPTPTKPSLPYDVRVSYKKNGCVSDVVRITPVPRNIGFNISGAQTVCSSSYETYSVDFIEGDKYEWSISPDYLGSVGEYPQDDQVDILWNDVAAPTQALIKVKMKKCGNTYVQAYPVTVQNTPQLSITAPATVCRGELVNFGVTGLSSWSYISWDFGDGATAINDGTPSHSFKDLNTGNQNYTVTLMVEDPNGCVNTATASITIQVLPAPVASISPGGASYCSQNELTTNPLTLGLTVQAGYPAATNIQWYGNGVAIGSAPPHTSITITQFGDYHAVLTGFNGCTFTTQKVQIRLDNCGGPGQGTCVPNGSITSLTAQMTACGTFVATAGHTGTPISFQWKVGQAGAVSNQSIGSADYVFYSAGNHIVFYEAVFNGTDANGDPCTVTLKKTISVHVPYKAGLDYTFTCGANGTYNVTLYDKSDYATIPAQNLEFRVNGNSVGSSGPVTVPLAPGIHNLELEISDPGGFPCTVMMPLTLPAMPTVQITAPIDACAGVPVQFNATVNYPNLQYDWDFGDFAKNSLQNPIRVFDGSPSNLIIKLTVTNRYGCSAKANHLINIQSAFVEGYLSLMPSPPPCYGGTITIMYHPTHGTLSQYIWHRKVDGVVVGTDQTSVGSLVVTEPGLYILDGETSGGCIIENIVRIPVIFLETPDAQIFGPREVCAESMFQLEASPYPVFSNQYEYTWKRDGQVLSGWNDEPVIDQQLGAPGIYNYEVEVTSALGCSDIAVFNVEVFPAPAPITVGVTLLSCDPYTVQLSAQTNEPGTFVWSDGQSGPNIKVHHGGPYRVVFFNQYGCTSGHQFDVPFNPDAYIWMHPEGCYEVCESTVLDQYLSGPLLPFQDWEWQINGNLENSGSGMVADQYHNGDGLYQLTLDNGLCSVTSEGMYWQTAPGGCHGWCEITIQVTGIYPMVDMYGNCYYVLDVIFINNDPPFSYSLDNLTNAGVIVPGGGVLPTGNTPKQLGFYPPHGFSGGIVDFRVLLELLEGGQPNCVIEFSVNFPPCPQGSSLPPKTEGTGIGEELPETGFTATPNPSRGILNIDYELQGFDPGRYSLHLYDQSGREILNQQLETLKGGMPLDLRGHADGLYLLLLRKNGKTLGFKRIILDR